LAREERLGERSFGCQPAHLHDDTVLCEDIPLGHPLKLALTAPVHGFIALDGPLRRGKRRKPHPRLDAALHTAMILL
jgi:hypothetical protein